MILRASDLKGFPGARHCGESVIEHIDPGPTMEEEYYFDVIIKAHNDDRLQRAAADLLGDLYDWSKQGIILARAEINYVKPVLFRDEMILWTRCSRIGNKSFDMEYRIVRTNSGEEELLADGKTIMVAFDYEKNLSIQIPQAWKDILLNYEGENLVSS